MSTVIEARQRHLGVTARRPQIKNWARPWDAWLSGTSPARGRIRLVLPWGNSTIGIMQPGVADAESAVSCRTADQRGDLRRIRGRP